ncbi:B3/B4 domain-containing protein [Alkaliphilus transvaalensis]|uniref:B3/B4 domain-containing protein n=1 Tax=Alkaliphilus transvaalensis TaxID=114628 RepID=UPI00047963AC|nr:phenylalanine--tRNA ligase beta subunit-related protein [Alkaliphilus transvaalensis]
MIKIEISEKINEVCPSIALGCIQGSVKVEDINEGLWQTILKTCGEISEAMEVADIAKSKNIKDGRSVYRSLGVDPTRYRLSSESLLRRAIKGKDLYQVNNVVDINNLISIKSMYPICLYDADKIDDTIYFTVGEAGDTYEGIGRGAFNVENFPVFADNNNGKFGSTTSDSEKTMITKETQEILMILVSFNGDEALEAYVKESVELLKKYADGEALTYHIIKK